MNAVSQERVLASLGRGGSISREKAHYSLEAEQAVLGGLLLDTSAWPAVADAIQADDFYRPDHRTIFDAIRALARNQKPTDAVSVSDQLDQHGRLSDVGGLAYLGTLVRDTATAANIRHHAEIVSEKSRQRRLLGLGSEVARAVTDGATSEQIVAALSSTLGMLQSRQCRTLAAKWLSELGDYAAPVQVVSTLLAAGSLVVIYGESNSGKTFFILDICMAIARGALWRKQRTMRGLVVYVAGEGAASVQARLAAYVLTYPDAATAPFLLIPGAVDLLDTGQVGSLIETIRGAVAQCGDHAALVVFDTLARSMSGGNENDVQDMGMAVAAGDRIRAELGCAVAFIHHAGKDPTKGARGSSALRAACDTEILVEGQSGPRTATVSKQRDLPYGEPIAFELKSVVIGQDAETGQGITSCVVDHRDGATPLATSPPALRGKVQRQLVSALRARTAADPSRIWTMADMRHIGQELGFTKSSRTSAVDALVTTPYLQATIGGYRFVDGQPKV